MSLRESKIRDHWRHVFARNYATRFTEITFQELVCLTDATVEFSGGITAIVGANGVGKSTLIAAISELLTNASSELALEEQKRMVSSRTRGTAFRGGHELKLEVQTTLEGKRVASGAQFDGEVRWLDPSSLSLELLTQIRKDSNFGDLLESVTPIELDTDELTTVSYLAGKDYTECLIFEISDYGEFDRFPYFVVRAGGVRYGSESMGRGELSLFLSYWTLRDLPKDSILILEEPETHVSPRSQDCLMNIVAKFCDERGIWVITATHSPAIIRRIPSKHIKLIARGSGRSAVLTNATATQIATILGGGVAFKGVFLVEDDGAKYFLLPILEDLASDLLPQFEVVVAGDATAISTIITAFPLTREWLTIIGVYDGGMEGKIKGKLLWPTAYLPGGRAPELLFKELADDESEFVARLGDMLHVTADDVVLALNHTSGMDHHEFVFQFATILSRSSEMVRQAFARLWMVKHEAEAQQFVKSLRASIDSLRR